MSRDELGDHASGHSEEANNRQGIQHTATAGTVKDSQTRAPAPDRNGGVGFLARVRVSCARVSPRARDKSAELIPWRKLPS
jgi:hypothetical protein